ncbi:ABC transporter permease [Microbacterium sp.]|uniref:ABC transporter permease n=1 Tax=Microbacterium sp. TaxID=51671 RepID=UPI0035672442
MVAGMCLSVLMTTGRTVGVEQAVLESIDDAGSRAIVVRAQPLAGLTTDLLFRLSSVRGIEWAGAFSSAVDYSNAAITNGPVVPVRSVFSLRLRTIGLPEEIGHEPVAYASAEALELAQVEGTLAYLRAVDGTQIPVVDSFDVPEFLSLVQPAVLVPERPESGSPIGLLVVVVSDPTLIEPVTTIVKEMLGDVNPDQLTVETSAEFAKLRAVVRSELGWSGRSLVFLILGLTAFLVAAVQYGSVLMKRRDYGRRRALGASRRLVAALVMGQALLQSAVGAAVGCAVSFAVLHAIDDPQPPATFYAGVGILSVVTGVLAAIIPAAFASRRDPLKELRIP